MIRFVAALLLSLGAVQAASAHAIDVHRLKTHWQRYDGKTVTLRGWIDECIGWNCNICPKAMLGGTAWDLCIPIAFARQNDPDYWQKGYYQQVLQRDLYRLATVTVRARFSALCLSDEKGKPVGGVICSDGPANLDNARVLAVHARMSASEAAIHETEGVSALAPAPAGQAEEMYAEFKLVLGLMATQKPFAMLAAVPPAAGGTGAPLAGLACVCLDDSCEGRWPTLYFPGLHTPANPFHCWDMRKTASGWRVIPDL